MKDFLQGRVDLVERLDASVPTAHYADKVLILTAVLSACASRRWPGERIDSKRFVELLVRSSPEHFHASWVSLPALLGDYPDADSLPGIPDTRILCGYEVDASYEEARSRYPERCARELRGHCYAALIYEWLRCGYAHEYWHDERLSHVPATDRKARVSYIGRITRDGHRRMVSFHLEYLIALTQYHVSILPDDPCPQPDGWWVDET